MNPPGALQLRDAVALVASRTLIGVADADVVAIYPGRAFGRHLDLHQSEDGQSEDERRRLWQVGNPAGGVIPDLRGMILGMATVPFDRSVLKVNQAILMIVIVAGYLVGLLYHPIAWALPVLAVMMLAAVASPSFNVPRLLYLRWLKPAGIVKPRVVQEDPAPHRFAQLVGGVFLAAASVFVITGLLLVAWVLAWIVAALAFLNFAFNICVGCIMYAQLVRVGLLPLSREPAL